MRCVSNCGGQLPGRLQRVGLQVTGNPLVECLLLFRTLTPFLVILVIILFYMIIIISVAVALAAMFSLSDSLLTILID